MLVCFSASGASRSIILYPIQKLELNSTFSYTATSGSNQEEAGGQVVGYGYSSLTQRAYGLMWTGPSGNYIGLQSGSWETCYVQATDDVQQVGNADDFLHLHALLWSGTSQSQIDLSPTKLAGFTDSWANGVGNSQQVGGIAGGAVAGHAALWDGSAATALDLNPSGFSYSEAFGTDGTHQVGDGRINGSSNHALLWVGTANSAVDLNPANFTTSQAQAVSGSQQVGFGSGNSTSGNQHALLWTGSAVSVVDLNPVLLSGFVTSVANGTNGAQQVGYAANANGAQHAMLWSGTGASAVDLQSLLPSDGVWQGSYADTIDSAGNIYGIAYGTYDGTANNSFAVEWSASNVPEPTCIVIVLVAILKNLLNRRGRRGTARARGKVMKALVTLQREIDCGANLY